MKSAVNICAERREQEGLNFFLVEHPQVGQQGQGCVPEAAAPRWAEFFGKVWVLLPCFQYGGRPQCKGWVASISLRRFPNSLLPIRMLSGGSTGSLC